MKQVIKETYDHILMNTQTEESIINLYHSINSKPKSKSAHLRKLAVTFAALLLIFIPTITVFASTDLFQDTFGKLFGSHAEMMRDNYTVPEVKVLENTFQDISIDIKGMTGDEHTVYIIMDITKNDGSQLNPEKCFFDGGIDIDKYFNYIKSHNPEADSIGTNNHFIIIPDDNSNDSKITLAYITDISIEAGDDIISVPCQSYYINIHNIYEGDGSAFAENLISMGSWKAELICHYDPATSISLSVNKSGKLPQLNTSDQYSYDFYVNDISLSPLALRLTTDLYHDPDLFKDTWLSIYIEMQDGSILGFDNFDDYSNYLQTKDCWYNIFGFNNYVCWIFPEAIDVNEVKSVHIGNLEIPIPHDTQKQ